MEVVRGDGGRTGTEWVTRGSPVFSQGMVCPAGLPCQTQGLTGFPLDRALTERHLRCWQEGT